MLLHRIYGRIEDFYYDTVHGIKNLIDYFKPVWNARRYDYSSSEAILLKSLQLTYKTLKNNGKTREKSLRKLSIAMTLLENMIRDDYDVRCGYIYPDFDNIPAGELFGNLTEEENEHNRIAIRKSIKLYNKEKRKFYKIMRKHAGGWWD